MGDSLQGLLRGGEYLNLLPSSRKKGGKYLPSTGQAGGGVREGGVKGWVTHRTGGEKVTHSNLYKKNASSSSCCACVADADLRGVVVAKDAPSEPV